MARFITGIIPYALFALAMAALLLVLANFIPTAALVGIAAVLFVLAAAVRLFSWIFEYVP
jgi:hypothetical protein